jgi:hypothetical protein
MRYRQLLYEHTRKHVGKVVVLVIVAAEIFSALRNLPRYLPDAGRHGLHSWGTPTTAICSGRESLSSPRSTYPSTSTFLSL